jgi:hypothetical protein
MRTIGAGLEAVVVGASIGARQVQYPATELIVLLDLSFRLRGASREFAVLLAGIDYLANSCFESRMIELQMDPQLGAQIGVTVCNHVDAHDRGDLLDILQSFERLDRWANNDVVVRPWAVFGGVASPISLVARVGTHLRDSAVSYRRILGFLDDGARFFRAVDVGDLYSHDALIQHGWNQMNECFMDAHDGRHFRGREPRSEVGDRFQIERAMLHVNHAVVKTGGFDDARNAPRHKLLQSGSERDPPFSYGLTYAVLFHKSPPTKIDRNVYANVFDKALLVLSSSDFMVGMDKSFLLKGSKRILIGYICALTVTATAGLVDRRPRRLGAAPFLRHLRHDAEDPDGATAGAWRL